MERLTFDGLFCDIVKCDSTPGGTFCETGTCTLRKVWERLKEYEDTGLEPEQVLELKSFIQGGIHKVDDGWKHIQELLQAERDGRLVVLPCKVGDWVYALWNVPTEYKYVIYCAEVKDIRHSNRNCRLTTTYLLEPIEFRGRRKEYRDDDFGKTVFLTREEAEVALAQKGGDLPENRAD